MIPKSYSCEKKCVSKEPLTPTQFIVITGGPGAGKTALLEFLRKLLCERITILPESASILFGGGFWRLPSPTAKISAQKSIYYIQNEIQNLVINEKKWSIGLCDRGTLDGAAYWPDKNSDFCEALNTTIQKEYAKYVAIIHLESPSANGGYNLENPIRIESPFEAASIDQQIGKVWKNHPNYNFVKSTTDFMEKVHEATTLVNFYLPKDCQLNLTK